jgi:predicted membrane channel-forming protein YqfA (hemolysin III family)
MEQRPIFKRKHYGTPQSTILIIINYVTFGVILAFSNGKIGWFFWIALALLAVYNYFNIRKDREEYNKPRIIAYVISIVMMVAFYFIFKLKDYR